MLLLLLLLTVTRAPTVGQEEVGVGKEASVEENEDGADGEGDRCGENDDAVDDDEEDDDHEDVG